MQYFTLPLGALQTNCYILADEQTKSAVVIDPAEDGIKLAEALDHMGLKVRQILLTHGHYDHVGGTNALHQVTGAPVWICARELDLPDEITGGPLFYTNTYDDGDVITVDGISLHVLATPGHSPGSVCLLAEHLLFAGDTLFAGSCGRTDLPDGSMEQMLSSLRMLSRLQGDYQVLPGHGPDSTMQSERATNHYLREAMRQ